MPRFHLDNRMGGSGQPLAAAFKTGVSMHAASGGTATFGRIVAIAVGLDGAPNATDTQIVFDVQRLTATGTGTAEVAQLLRNPGGLGAASRNTCTGNYTAEPTYTALSQLWQRVLNQRASMQWNAQDQDANLEWSAGGSAVPVGVGVRGSGGATPVTANFFTGVEFDE